MVRTEKVPNQDANPADVERDLEPSAILITLEIVRVEVPMPGSADHGPNRVSVLMEGDDARLENQLVAGGHQPSASVSVPPTPATFGPAITTTRAASHSGTATQSASSEATTSFLAVRPAMFRTAPKPQLTSRRTSVNFG
jgi:hypothetical protein